MLEIIKKIQKQINSLKKRIQIKYSDTNLELFPVNFKPFQFYNSFETKLKSLNISNLNNGKNIPNFKYKGRTNVSYPFSVGSFPIKEAMKKGFF